MASQFGGYGGSDFADAAYAGQATSPTQTATSLPTLTVLVAFTTAPGSANPVFVDVSDDVRTVRTRRGRQRELDKFQAGTCEIVLDNRNRQYDPSYSAGPNFGNIKPMKRIKVLATYAGVTYGIFDGYADNWAQAFENPKEARCHLTATDGFKVLAIQALGRSAYAAEVTADAPTHWYRLGDTSGATVALDSGPTPLTGTVVGTAGFGATGLITGDTDTAANFTTNGNVNRIELPGSIWPTSGDWSLEFWFKTASATSPTSLFESTTVAQGVGGTLAGVFDMEIFILGSSGLLEFDMYLLRGVTTGQFVDVQSTTNVADNVLHHAVLVAQTSSPFRLYVDGVLNTQYVDFTGSNRNSPGPPSQVTFAINEFESYTTVSHTIDEVAIYNQALSATRIAAHNTVGKNAWKNDLPGARINRILAQVGWNGGQNIATGATSLQSATTAGVSCLTHAQLVEQTEAGLLFTSKDGAVTFIDRLNRYNAPTSLNTFGDGGTDIGYQTFAYDVQDQPISNDVRVTMVGGTEQRVTDATSTSDYYQRTLTISGLLHQTDAQSQSRAQYELANRKDLLERVTGMEVLPMATPATYFPAVLGREVHDSVTVKRLPQGVGSSISQLSVIEGIQHEIAPRHWKTNFYVSPVSGIATDGTAVSKQYWVLGIAGASELGQTTRLGF